MIVERKVEGARLTGVLRFDATDGRLATTTVNEMKGKGSTD